MDYHLRRAPGRSRRAFSVPASPGVGVVVVSESSVMLCRLGHDGPRVCVGTRMRVTVHVGGDAPVR